VIFDFRAWFDYFLIILVKVKYFQKPNSDPKTGSNFIFVSFNYFKAWFNYFNQSRLLLKA